VKPTLRWNDGGGAIQPRRRHLLLFNLGSPLFAARHDDPKHTGSQNTRDKANYSNVVHMASPLQFEM
jgi:hypothetical protein